MPLVRKHRSPPAVDRVVQDLDRALAATIASPGPEEVHALRVALKRVRSLLRLGRHTPGCRTPERIRRRLDRLFELAGRVRDRHVLLALLANEVPTRTSFALFRKRLMKDAPKADARLQRALRRHERVVEEVHTALADGLGRSGPAAWRRALVKAIDTDLRDASEHLHRDDAADALHTVRKRIKHVVHALDLWPDHPVPRELARLRQRCRTAQQLLGTRQDLVMLHDLLTGARKGHAADPVLAARVTARLHRMERRVRSELNALLPEGVDHFVPSTRSSSAFRPKRKTASAGRVAAGRSTVTVKPAARRRST
ncbi:MAG: CHAD domain-containing protein [Flavobacteriales bacterium]|nr:CHAD domain-containing protein [Flavobacteriales bacterium]